MSHLQVDTYTPKGRLAQLAILLLIAILATACGPAAAAAPAPATEVPTLPAAAEPSIVLSPTPNAPTAIAAAPTTMPTSTQAPLTIWLGEFVPANLAAAIQPPAGWAPAQEEASASLRLEAAPAGPSQTGDIQWIYTLAAAFPTVPDEISLIELKNAWRGGPVEKLPMRALLVDASTHAVFENLWGPSANFVKIVPGEKLLETAWGAKNAWAILPFEQLEPRWKVLLVDGQSPVRKDFDPRRYPLTAAFRWNGDAGTVEQFLALAQLPETNYRADHLTTVMMTGVTAMVRGTASFMEGRGMTYPAKEIGPWLRNADILHVSNEVPFARNCPQPFDWQDLVFCSQTEYIQLLEDVGTDVVELTGDHFADWGPEAMLYTLELYKERDWKYYGGGANLQEAQQPALFEHNGNKIAFLGCNGKEPGYAKAGANEPGAGHCDFDALAVKIKELRSQGYQVIFTFQHLEYYQYIALPELEVDFHKVSDAGAVIVSGSQAHQPHAFEFRDGSLLHYGLGNLFFDQTNQGDPPRTAFLDRHVFYEGRHISTELLTIYFVDYALSRPMTPAERKQMLETVFEASRWQEDEALK